MVVNDKRKFLKISLANRGISMAQMARNLSVTPAAICMVLSGKTKSAKIDNAINDLINAELLKLKTSYVRGSK